MAMLHEDRDKFRIIKDYVDLKEQRLILKNRRLRQLSFSVFKYFYFPSFLPPHCVVFDENFFKCKLIKQLSCSSTRIYDNNTSDYKNVDYTIAENESCPDHTYHDKMYLMSCINSYFLSLLYNTDDGDLKEFNRKLFEACELLKIDKYYISFMYALSMYPIGMVCTAEIIEFLKNGNGIRCAISNVSKRNIICNVNITEISDDPEDFVIEKKKFVINQLVYVKIIGLAYDFNPRSNLIFEGSICLSKTSKKSCTGEFLTFKDIKVGKIFDGYVTNSSEKGVFVSISPYFKLRIKLSNLSNDYVDKKTVQDLYPLGKYLSKFSIIHIDEKFCIEGRLKSRKRKLDNENSQKKLSIEYLSINDIVDARVKRQVRFGILLDLDEFSGFKTYCHSDELFDDDVEEKNRIAFKVNDKVKAKVLTIDATKKVVTVGLKSQYFEGLRLEGDGSVSTPVSNKITNHVTNEDTFSLCNAAQDKKGKANDDYSSESFTVIGENDTPGNFLSKENRKSWIFDDLKVYSSKKTDEDVSADSNDSGIESEVENTELLEQKKPINKRKKLSEQKKKEIEISIKERHNENSNLEKNPQTYEDFERILLYKPNNSAVWISYIAYFLQLNELSKAREVAERGLKLINFREEKERENLWLAYLNMECIYGNKVNEIFRRAIKFNNAKKFFLKMIEIYDKNNFIEELFDLLKEACRKFYYSKKIWLKYLETLYKRNEFSEARSILLEALKRTERKKHYFIITSSALFEYKYGSVERGQTLFVKLLTEHPKRSDIWLQYLDAHIKAKTSPVVEKVHLQSIRTIFEKVVTMKFKPRTMKLFFIKWLSFEKQYGTVDDESHVQNLAGEYVKNAELMRHSY